MSKDKVKHLKRHLCVGNFHYTVSGTS